MVTALVPVLLAAAAPYFVVDAFQLWRLDLELAPPQAAGRSTLLERGRAAVRLPGLVLGHHQRGEEAIAVVCPRSLAATDSTQGCPLFHVDGRGVARPLGVRALWAALLPQGRFLYWTDEVQLRSRALEGGVSTLHATSVLEPHVGDDGVTVGLARSKGLHVFAPGFDACPARLSLGQGEPTLLPGPCEAQGAFLSPSGRAVYVSTDTGTATLYVDGVPLEAPVPGRELVWLDGDRALYTHEGDAAALWLLDARSRTAHPLGPGRAPVRLLGQLVAYDGTAAFALEVPSQ